MSAMLQRTLLFRTVLLRTLLLSLAASTWAAAQGPTTRDDVDAWMRELSEAANWGPTDELGAVNRITEEKRRTAARSVESGVSVSLARTAEKVAAADNPSPFEHVMLRTGDAPGAGQFVSDRYGVSYHGYAHTHMDSLAHMSAGGLMYNGLPQAEVTASGAPRLDVANFKEGIFTRGVLMDIPKLKGVDYLEPGTPILTEDLQAWAEQAGIEIEQGDVVFIRTGRWKLRDAKGAWDAGAKSAGLHASAAVWLAKQGIAMLGSDAASDVMPSGIEGVRQPVHQLMLVAAGIPIFDNCDLEAVAAEADRQGRWTFLLTAAPLPVEGGTGSPLNPIATF